MKTLINIRYLLFAIGILGLFASFAQNDYGQDITNYVTGFTMLVSFILVFFYIKPIWRKNKFIGILSLFIPIGFLLMPPVFNFLPDSVGMIYVIFLWAVLLFLSIMALIENRKLGETGTRFLFMESLGVFTLFGGAFFKAAHYPGASPFLIGTFFLFIFLYLVRGIAQLGGIRRTPALAVFKFLYYTAVSITVTGVVFKYQHFPLTTIILGVALVLMCVVFILMLFRLKLQYKGEKINAASWVGKLKGSALFIFIYITYYMFYLTLATRNIIPSVSMMSSPPISSKMAFDDKIPEHKLTAYNYNFANFVNARYDAESSKALTLSNK